MWIAVNTSYSGGSTYYHQYPNSNSAEVAQESKKHTKSKIICQKVSIHKVVNIQATILKNRVSFVLYI